MSSRVCACLDHSYIGVYIQPMSHAEIDDLYRVIVRNEKNAGLDVAVQKASQLYLTEETEISAV